MPVDLDKADKIASVLSALISLLSLLVSVKALRLALRNRTDQSPRASWVGPLLLAARGSAGRFGSVLRMLPVLALVAVVERVPAGTGTELLLW